MSSLSVSRLCYTFRAMFSFLPRPSTKVFPTVLLAAVSLLAAACGGSTSLTTPTSPTVTSAPSTSSPETSLPPVDSPAVDGLEVLYMGHSFGRPFAEILTDAATAAGVDGHVQHIVSRGGEKGAPQAMWEDARVRAQIEEVLDTGEIDVVIMMCCSSELIASELTYSWAELEIAEYALARNPETRFGLGLPWVDFPADYDSAADHRQRSDDGYHLFDAFANQLSEDLGGADVFAFYHGTAIYELRDLFEQGLLPDVIELTGPASSSVFTDRKGHAGNIAKDAGILIWLNAIYGIDPLAVPFVDGYQVDLRQVAADALVSAAELLGDDGDGEFSSPFAASVDRILMESSDLDPATESFLRSLGPGPFVASEFAELVSSSGLIYRVVELDGQPQPVTMDYRTDRLNVVVSGDMVVSISSVS